MAIEFEVKLSDGVTAPAGSAAHEVDVLQKALRGLQSQMLRANAVADDKAYQRAGERYQKAMARLQELGGEHQRFGVAAKVQQVATQGSTSKIGELAKAFTDANQPAGMLGQAVKVMGPELMAVAGAAVAAAAAIAAVGAAFIYAIKVASEFAQQQRAMENTFNALGRGTTTGKQMSAMFDELGKVLPMSRDQMAELNKAMMQGGVTDMPRLMQATKAAAAANALMGDTSGKAGEKISGLVVEINKAIKARTGIGDIATTLEGTGISAEEVAAKMGIGVRQLKMMAASGVQLNKIGNAIQDALIRKGMGPMRDMMSTWDVVSKKIKDSTAKLFSGITETQGFKMFSEQLVRLLNSFDSAAGRTKGSVTNAFDLMFKIAAKMLQEFRYAILRAEISMLRMQLAVAPVVKAIKKLDNGFNYAGLAVDTLSWAIDAMIATIKTAIPGVNAFSAAVSALEFAGEFASKGFAKGLKKGTPQVKDAAKGLASAASGGVTDTLQIKSPSRVFVGYGAHAGTGFALGMQSTTPAVMSASTDLARSAARGPAMAPITPAPRAGANRGGVNVTLASGAIQITSNGGSPVDLLEEAVVSLFERVALTQGVA